MNSEAMSKTYVPRKTIKMEAEKKYLSSRRYVL